MSDLVRRLREYGGARRGAGQPQNIDCREAADRIEQLERDLADARQREEDAVSQHDALRDQRDAEKALSDALLKSLEEAVSDVEENGRYTVQWWVDDARAALAAHRKARGL